MEMFYLMLGIAIGVMAARRERVPIREWGSKEWGLLAAAAVFGLAAFLWSGGQTSFEREHAAADEILFDGGPR